MLALAPIALILGLMAGLRWSAVSAGLAGLAVALAVALLGFGYGQGAEGPGPALAVGGAFAEAGFVAGTIIWIIFAALCIYELQLAGGAFEEIKTALARLSDDPRILALLIGGFFALFLEGAAGFGIPVALAAPLLVSQGFPPVTAVTLAMVGHAAGVSFGAIGTPVLPQIAVTGFTGPELARATGLLHGALGWMLLLLLFWMAGAGGRRAAGRGWIWAAAAALCFFAPYLAIAAFVGPELPTIGGALIGGLAFVALLRRRAGAAPAPAADGPRRLAHVALPYLVLVALILATRLIPSVQAAVQAVEWSWRLPGGFAGAVQPLYHPGTLLFAGFLLGGVLQRRSAGALGAAMARAARRLPRVLIALAAMLGVARLMVHSGMIAALSEAAAQHLGAVWPALAPFVGVLGTFVTGSATASNILLTDFQEATALRLELSALWLVAAQGFGAAVGNIICPHNVVAGAATVGLSGREGEVLRRTLAVCLLYALAGGALVAALVGWA